MRALLTLPSVLAVTLVLAACGGDDRLSAKDYRAQATDVCNDAQAATKDVTVPTRLTKESISTYFRALLGPSVRATDRFAKLTPPEELQQAHDEVLASNRETEKVVRGVIADVDGGQDPAAVVQTMSTRLRALVPRAKKAADQLGVPACADA